MTLPIDYRDLRLVILIIFAAVGIMRGFYREGITTLFVSLLAILVWRPETGRGIIDWINSFIRFILTFVRAGFTFDTARLTAEAARTRAVLDPSSYQLWITITVIMLVISYVIGETSFPKNLTPLGRLLGGILGAANGLVILSLARQYLADYWRAQGLVVAQSGPVTVQFNNVPVGSFAGGSGIVFVLVILVAVIVLLIAGDRMRWPLK